jgi:hypothetical protein
MTLYGPPMMVLSPPSDRLMVTVDSDGSKNAQYPFSESDGSLPPMRTMRT